jgi:peptide/nickel transport system substrate-binding protein
MLFMTVLAFMLGGLGLHAQAASPQKGGVLKVAMKGQPPSLDMHYSTSNVIRNVALHINEGLFTFDNDYNPVPMLAKSFTISDDGLVHTFKLWEGIKFHNGQKNDLGRCGCVHQPLSEKEHLRQTPG